MSDNGNSKTFKVGDRTVTDIDKVKNRDRAAMRRVLNEVRDLSADPDTAVDFAVIVAYTTEVDGDGWQPPASYADRDTLRAAFEDWYANGDVSESTPWVRGLLADAPEPSEDDAKN